MPVSMDKIKNEAPNLLKTAQAAQSEISNLGLDGVLARVAVVLDRSGSARWLYANGSMQSVAERILAVATRFDDDGDIDLFTFGDRFKYHGTLSISNYEGGVIRLVGDEMWGSTPYDQAFDGLVQHYFSDGVAGPPVYAAFLTDGAPDDKKRSRASAAASSRFPLFVQSVGMGGKATFKHLANDLNDHGGLVDNFGFFSHPEIASMPDIALLQGLLNEFPGWFPKARAAGVLP